RRHLRKACLPLAGRRQLGAAPGSGDGLAPRRQEGRYRGLAERPSETGPAERRPAEKAEGDGRGDWYTGAAALASVFQSWNMTVGMDASGTNRHRLGNKYAGC